MNLREKHIARLGREELDVLVIGGGINGAVSALALAAHGARTGLIDKGDFASQTSQSSSNLVWGGIKYLENLEFPLVRSLCKSRNRLVDVFGDSVREIRFLALPGSAATQSLPALYAGTWLYWLLGGCRTGQPRFASNSRISAGEPALDAGLRGGVEYSDAWLPGTDARFTLDLIFAAMRAGAAAANYAEAVSARREGSLWRIEAHDRAPGTERKFDVRCRAVVNAAGPFADGVNELLGVSTVFRHVFSRGMHLVVPRLQAAEEAVVIFAGDGRPFFLLPFGSLTMIGTTDTPVESPQALCTAADRNFLLETVNSRLKPGRRLAAGDIIAERCGVRPLALEKGKKAGADWMALSRRHKVETVLSAGAVTIFGGKLTDCLNVAEDVLSEIRRIGIPLKAADPLWHGALKTPRPQIKTEGGVPLVELGGERYSRPDIERMAENEMIVTEDDFLRRRTALALKAGKNTLLEHPGIKEALSVISGEAG